MDSILFKDVKGLAKNPLGIIALFIALIYGFATLLLGVSADKLVPDERYPIIWFIVLFLLVVFYLLVTNHHGKLYAPTDFKNDESFLKTLTEKQREDKLEDEIRSAETVTLDDSSAVKTDDSVRFSRNETSEIKSEIKNSRAIEGLRTRYIHAEKLAIAKVEKDTGLMFRKHVAFGGKKAAAFDGVAIQDEVVTALEVKLLRKSLVPPSFIRETLYRGFVALDLIKDKLDGAKFKLIIALVVEDESRPLQEIKKIATRIVEDAPFPVELCVYTLSSLETELDPEAIPTP